MSWNLPDLTWKEEIFVQNDMVKIFRPVFFLFTICGIDPRDPQRRWVLVLAVVYNVIVWIISFTLIYCTTFEPLHFGPILDIIVNLGHWIMWWLIRIRMKNIIALVNKLQPLGEDLEFLDYRRFSKMSWVISFCATFFNCLYPAVSTVQTFNYRYNRCPLKMLEAEIPEKAIAWFAFNIGIVYINFSIIYAFFSFYILYCFILASCLVQRQRPELVKCRLYKTVIEIFEAMENTLSIFVLLLFAHFLLRFFRSLYLLLYAFRVGNLRIPYTDFLDVSMNIALIVIFVLSAEHAQKMANKFRLSLLTFRNESQTPDWLKARSIRILEDREQLNLTAWGVFTVRKALLLSVTAWFFTYSAILIQFA
ncbi:hypothetical protein AVEN_236654-1 [Araneus ventricosus]|uniref:Gustatory receptor n=1 Tax=Araneus ventricosus TaxID=182803 RepID=A0A4Y2IH33_ARAVE|nr:hypothetical protein AVEN_236654-1 [Araneus ventricosus]